LDAVEAADEALEELDPPPEEEEAADAAAATAPAQSVKATLQIVSASSNPHFICWHKRQLICKQFVTTLQNRQQAPASGKWLCYSTNFASTM
jgi:hypothetical protein